MPGKTSLVSPLESRKRLLIAESELSRVQLSEEGQMMAHEARALGHQAKTVAAWASSAALLVTGFTALRRGLPRSGTAKSPWLLRILKGARAASALWLALRPRNRN